MTKYLLTICLCVLARGNVTFAATQTIDFENAFGLVGPTDIVNGPGDYDFGPVYVDSPDVLMFNIGQQTAFPFGGATPFGSDFLYLFTFGSGATFTFDVPITSVSFEYGQRFNVESSSLYGLFAQGHLKATFTHDSVQIGNNGPAPISHFSYDFAAPVTQVALVTVAEGSTTGLGIDALSFNTVPEPAAGLLVMLATAVRRGRRRASCATTSCPNHRTSANS
jgi:hypothetical protein